MQPTLTEPVSQRCTQAQFEGPEYAAWSGRLRLEAMPPYHRKSWELVWIMQVLEREGMLRPGARGIGFGVGKEPLSAYMASVGCEVVATDYPAAGWEHTHARSVADMTCSICDLETMQQRVRLERVDMRRIPKTFTGFDFCWSTCALEHLGSLGAGWEFVRRSLDCLKPDGIAVHTTELCVSSFRQTVSRGGFVLYRERDVEDLAAELTKAGHGITLNLARGDGPYDNRALPRNMKSPPHHICYHVGVGSFVTTSIGLAIRKGHAPPVDEARRAQLSNLFSWFR